MPLPESKELWDFIETKDEEVKRAYWSGMEPNFYHLSAVDKTAGVQHLLQYKRFFTSLHMCSIYAENLPTDLLVDVLKRTATEKASEEGRLRNYDIDVLFDIIDKRGDVADQTLFEIEWLYLSILASYGSSRSPRILHQELSRNPQFFTDVLQWVFASDDKDIFEREKQGVTEELLQKRAHNGYDLLHSWKQLPGTGEDNSIDEELLNDWVDTVGKIAEETGRLEVADMQIGQVLAQYPEKTDNWPPSSISEVIERINTRSIKSNFSAALYNKRGSSSRGPFDGGNIEREHANYFDRLAKHNRLNFPVVAEIFANLARGYFDEARLMDERAKRDQLEY